MAQIIYHAGTGTYFGLDDDVYIIHTHDVPEGLLDDLFTGGLPEIEEYGVELKILLPDTRTAN